RSGRERGSMSTTTTETKATVLDRTGMGAGALSVIALAVPLLYTAFGSSSVTLKSSDDIKTLFSNGIIVTVVAAVLGLIGTGVSLPGLMQVRTGARMATTGVSALVLIGSLLFLLVGILPRANAVSNLQDNIKPFAKAVRDNCKTPLDKVNADY